MTSRRSFIAQGAGFVAAVAVARNAWPIGRSSAPIPITVYKSSTCQCCTKWVEHLRANRFDPTVHDESDMDAIKDEMGVPTAVRSCHTALVDKYLIEGHVPAADIRRLLAERPKVAGLAVPGMPTTTPGMAAPGAAEGPYDVLAFTTAGGTSLVAHH
jgi:hypothetical protein